MTSNRTQFEQQQGGVASYFVTDLLRRIDFTDRQLGTSSKYRVRRQVRQQIILRSRGADGDRHRVIPAATSYLDNIELMDGTRSDVEKARATSGEALKTSAALEGLDCLQERVLVAGAGERGSERQVLVGSVHRAAAEGSP